MAYGLIGEQVVLELAVVRAHHDQVGLDDLRRRQDLLIDLALGDDVPGRPLTRHPPGDWVLGSGRHQPDALFAMPSRARGEPLAAVDKVPTMRYVLLSQARWWGTGCRDMRFAGAQTKRTHGVGRNQRLTYTGP
jgi:hypothetical protein